MTGRAVKIALLAAALVGLVFGLRQLRVRAAVGGGGSSCVGDLDRQTNPSGFTSSDFTATTAVQISSSGAQPVQLDTDQVPLDPQKIVLPFDQDLTVKYVYRNAGASHMLGWFYFDQLKQGAKPFVVTTNGVDTLADWDKDGIADWFETTQGSTSNRPQDGLWHISGSNTLPDLANSALGYADQTKYYYPHMPHVLELLSGVANSSTASDHLHDFIFRNCDDDGDLVSWPSGNGYTPVPDVSSSGDGIPDYDVNGDGTAGNNADRSVDLGTVEGNREIVFYAVTFYEASLPNAGVGLSGTGSTTVRSLPWFTKNILNPDRGQKAANTVLQKQAIGCARDDSSCYTAAGANIGWLDSATISRLNSADYNYLQLDKTVNTIKTDGNGNAPHFVVNAPSTDPNRWVLALEDLPVAAADLDYNDVVFLIERTNGGEVVSTNMVQSSDLPSGVGSSDVMVSKIRFRFTASYPSGCSSVPDANIQFYWSVDKKTWYPMSFPIGATSGDLAIDVLGQGAVGHEVYWKADFVSSSQYCQPILKNANLGYEAIPHGEYKFAAPVPVANVVFNGSMETPSTSWTVTRDDYAVSGHFYSTPLFDPTTMSEPATLTPSWDAGQVLAQTSPSTRLGLFTNTNGVYTAFTSSNGSTLYPLLLSATDRTVKSGTNLLFDFNGDGVADDKDAAYVMEWTRGLEYPQNPPTGSTTSTSRAWKLGPVHDSSPAVIGTPGHPTWLDGTNPSLATYKTAYAGTSWLGDTSSTGIMNRRTLAIVGAQDGLVHAFDAGNFHNATEQACASQSTRMVRGCFAPSGGGTTPDYGTGKEVFAYVPPTLLNALKNNVGPIHDNPSYPQAEVDGSVAVDDIYYVPKTTITGQPANQFVTAAFASLGRRWDAITALGWTKMQFGGSTPVTTLPFPLWQQDWTDADYHGSAVSPAVGVADTPGGVKWVMVTTSGLATPTLEGTVPEYLYVVDASTGWTYGASAAPPANTGATGKVALDATGATAYGFAGFPSLVDSNEDGVYDRAYAVDTAGRVFRVDLKTFKTCKIANVGEPVFTGLATSVVNANQVRIYVGGGSNPDGTDIPATGGSASFPPYHVFGYEDTDTAGTSACATAKLVYKYATPSSGNEKVWAAPYISGDTVYVATSGSSEEGICADASGSFFGLSTDGDGSGTNPQPTTVTPIIALSNAGVSSIRIFDGHAFINGISQQTAVLGKSGWNNSPSGSGISGGVSLDTLRWGEY
jgi:type IV pilus assembly protein PilY1